jgi:hypothetical protein
MVVETSSGLSIPIPSGLSHVVVPNGARMLAAAPTECQLATFVKGVHADFSTP